AFTKGYDSGIFLISAAGTHEQRLTDTTSEEQDLTWTPDGREGAYTSTPHSEIYAVDVTGSRREALTSDGTSDGQLARSRDGSSVAFVRRRATGRQRVVTDVGGGRPRVLARLSSLADPSWSPDASELAVASGQGISLVGTDRRVRRLTHDPIGALALAWSPNRRSITVVEGDGLHLIDVRSGRGDELLTPNVPDEAEYASLSWSPDSTAVAFSFGRARDPGFVGLHVVSTSGKVIAHVAGATDPAWSPDGRRIAYAGGDGGVWAMDRSGLHRSRIESRVVAADPRWSQDSRSIAFRAGGFARANGVWLVDADGGTPRQI